MEPSARRAKVVVLATGGTIASTRGDRAHSHDYEVTQGGQALLQAVPRAQEWADLECVDLFSVPSHDIGWEQWVLMRSAVQARLDDPEVDGVVLTHGTDSLEETAYFLGLTVRSPKPIVLTGAMRPSDHASPDGPSNLLGAMAVASSPQAHGKGALVVMGDSIYDARTCSKAHTTSVAAFEGAGDARLGHVLDRDVVFLRAPYTRQTLSSEFAGPLPSDLPVVDIIYDHPSARVALYEAALASGSHGIVIAGMGNGSLSPGARAGARLAQQQGVPVVRSSRCGHGPVTPQGFDAQLSTIAAGTLNPQKARVLVMVSLAHDPSGRQLARQFANY